MDERSLIEKPSNKDASPGDAVVVASTYWWGFKLKLNHAAVEYLLRIDALIRRALYAEEELAPLTNAISAYIQAKDAIIQACDKFGLGVELASPWVLPLLLAPTAAGQGENIDDSQLRWIVYGSDDQNNWAWSDEHKMVQAFSEAAPALAVFLGNVCCVARGGGSDQTFYWMYYDGSSWSNYEKINGWSIGSNGTPALAVFQDKLYVVARGENSDQTFYCMTFDGELQVGWSRYYQINSEAGSPDGPALAVFNGTLYLAYRSEDHQLYYMTFDGSYWSTYQHISSPASTGSAPALVVFQDRLFCVFRGNTGESTLWYMTFDGNDWSPEQQISEYVFSGDTPSLAVFQNKLYCVARGLGDESLWWMTFDGESWSQYVKIDNAYSGYMPALVYYRAPQAQGSDQLLCVHRGIQT